MPNMLLNFPEVVSCFMPWRRDNGLVCMSVVRARLGYLRGAHALLIGDEVQTGLAHTGCMLTCYLEED